MRECYMQYSSNKVEKVKEIMQWEGIKLLKLIPKTLKLNLTNYHRRA